MMLKRLYAVAIVLSILLCSDLIIGGAVTHQIAVADAVKAFARINPEQIELIGLALIYVLWITSRSVKPEQRYTNLLRLSAPFLLVAWLSYPITKDIYLYIQYGLISLSGLNTYTTPAGSFVSTLSPLLDWDQSSPYGIVSLFFFVVSAKAAQLNLFLGVYLFKAICLGFHILNSYLIWNLTKPENRSKITLAYLLNPALLFEQVVNAHVDIFICTILIALYCCLRLRSYLFALLLIWVGFLTKTLPILWLPMISVLLVRQKRWKTIARFALISLAIVLVLQFTVFPTPEAWRSVLNPGIGTRTAGSLHNLLSAALMHSRSLLTETSKATIQQLFKLVTYAAFGIYYSLMLIKIYRRNNPDDLIVQIGWVTFILFLFATPWYQPWYATILIPIALLNLQARFFVIAALTFSLISTIAYFCFNFDQTKPGLCGTFIVMAIPIALLFFRSKLLASTQLPTLARLNSRS